MAIELYQHNQDTYEKMIEMFQSGTRVGVVQPTGTGKSFLYLKWIEDHPQSTFTILSPSTEIFTQLQEYAEDAGAPDLLQRVHMVSYQALLRMTDEEIRAIHSDKMVLDEFHRTGAEQWGPALQRLLESNPNAQILGASATPVRYLDDSKDMASELFDRNLAVEMTLGEAVRREILPLPTYVPVWYDLDGTMANYKKDIVQTANPRERRELEEKLDLLKRRLEDSYGAEDIFRKHMPHNGKFIVFCRNRDHLEEMQKAVPSWLSGINDNVHSYVSISAQEDKDLHLQQFKNDKSEDAIKLLFTIDRLNEGLHVKGIDGVMMLRPTTSPIIYLQQMGRALSSGQRQPLIFDFVNNYENIKIPLKDGTAVNVFEKEFQDASPRNIIPEEFKIFEDAKKFSSLFSELEQALYLSYDEKWNENFRLYIEFKKLFDREPKERETYKGSNIGVWCMIQRSADRKGILSAERKQRLSASGFVFVSDPHDAEWQNNFQLYTEYKCKFGEEPKIGEIFKDVNLGNWVNHQRKCFKKGILPEDRKQKLLKAGFVFDRYEAEWLNFYQHYVGFKKEFGQEPKDGESYKGVKLGAWVSRQRQAFKKGTLSDERKQKLMEANFVFSFDSLVDLIADAANRVKNGSEEGKTEAQKATSPGLEDR